MIIRNQFNAIVSQYRDWPFDPREVRIGKPVSLDKWIQIALEDDFVKYFSTLKYYEIADIYSEIFGSNNVGLFLFEELVRDLPSFAKNLSEFLQVDPQETRSLLLYQHENLSVSHRYNVYRMLCRSKLLPYLDSSKLRILPNDFKKNISNYLKAGYKKEYQISLSKKKELRKIFAASNEKLQKNYRININTYDYPE